MKITDVKLRFAKHYLFVQVYTDAGIVGLGEAGNWGYLQATAAAIEKFATYLIGKDPFRIEDYNQNFLRSVYFRGSVIMSAISAIDIALWDIKGKALGVPVYELLGGKTREKVRVYASVMHITEDKNELAAQYQQLQEMGFTAAKIFCNGPTSAPDRKQGLMAYTRLNILASHLVREGGVLVSSSCSQHLDALELRSAISRAAARTQRVARIFYQGGQGPDHPANSAMLETSYLKCFMASFTK